VLPSPSHMGLHAGAKYVFWPNYNQENQVWLRLIFE